MSTIIIFFYVDLKINFRKIKRGICVYGRLPGRLTPPWTLSPETWSIVHGGHVRLPIVPSPDTALHTVRSCETHEGQGHTWECQTAWSITEIGEAVRWALHNFWRSWFGCLLKPDVTISAWDWLSLGRVRSSTWEYSNGTNPMVTL